MMLEGRVFFTDREIKNVYSTNSWNDDPECLVLLHDNTLAFTNKAQIAELIFGAWRD